MLLCFAFVDRVHENTDSSKLANDGYKTVQSFPKGFNKRKCEN